MACLFSNVPQHLFSLWIILGCSARQDQAAVAVFFDQAVGLDHYDGVLETVEPGYLQKDRLVPRNVQSCQNSVYLFRAQLPILIAERINRRLHEELWDGDLLRKFWQREDRSIVFSHVLPEVAPGLSLGM